MGRSGHGDRAGRGARAGLGLLLALGLAPVAATAQTVLDQPAEIAACLCLERDMAIRQGELTVRANAYEQLARQIGEEEAALDRDRPRVDVNDQSAVDAFRTRLERLDALKTRQMSATLPDYQAATAAYGERVTQFNQRCANRGWDARAVDVARANLVCRLTPP